MLGNRTCVFIDNSNIYKSLCDLRKIDRSWVKMYDPANLSARLIGEKHLVQIYFYCSPPPAYLQVEQPDTYNMQLSYYSAIAKLPLVTVKYGRLVGSKGNMSEKNLDTQMTADISLLAAQNSYDFAYIVSNDGDFESAVDTAKVLGKKVINASFKNMDSMALRKKCDYTIRLRRSFFSKMLC